MVLPDPTLVSQLSGRDTTLLSNPFDVSLEMGRGVEEEDPLSQFPNEDEVLDFALDDARSFSVERGRDAMSVNLDDEFGSIRGLNDDLEKPFAQDDPLEGGFGDGLEGGFGDPLDFGFGDDLPVVPITDGTPLCPVSRLMQTSLTRYFTEKLSLNPWNRLPRPNVHPGNVNSLPPTQKSKSPKRTTPPR
jgi:hypothetical protein